MDLIDFLEGAYQGGRLLYLLKQHDKKVKDRYKRIKFKRYEDGFVSTTTVQIQETQRKTQELQREYNEILRERTNRRRGKEGVLGNDLHLLNGFEPIPWPKITKETRGFLTSKQRERRQFEYDEYLTKLYRSGYKVRLTRHGEGKLKLDLKKDGFSTNGVITDLQPLNHLVTNLHYMKNHLDDIMLGYKERTSSYREEIR